MNPPPDNKPVSPRGVILIISDHHRWDHLGCAGMASIHTPNIDRLASHGCRVSGMYSTAPLCVPQRIGITSGRYSMNTGCFTNRHPVDPSIPTFLHQLQRAGVRTAMIGKLHHHVHVLDADFVAHQPDVHRLGFDHVVETSGKIGAGAIGCRCRYTEFLEKKGLIDSYRTWTGRFGKSNGTRSGVNDAWRWDASATQDHFIADQVCQYIDTLSEEQPFYIHAGLVGPHPPFDAPLEYRKAYEQMPVPAQVQGDPAREATWRAFAGCISEVDHMVGRIVAALESRGWLDETLVLYTSDHGDNAGYDGRWGKVNFYDGSVRVPFIARGPGITTGACASAMAELIDIGSTVCDAFGVTSHDLDQGRSLMPTLRGHTDTHRTETFSEMGSDKMLFDGRYKLMYGDLTRDTRSVYLQPPYNGPAFGRPVHLPPDKIAIYDLQNDPDERRNLADLPEFSVLQNDLIRRLLNRMIANTQPAKADPGSVL